MSSPTDNTSAPVPSDTDLSQVKDLVESVRDLTAAALASSERMAELRIETAKNTAEAERLAKRGRFDRRAIIAAAIAIVVDVAFSLLLLNAYQVQHCLNTAQRQRNISSDQFYTAEIAKVTAERDAILAANGAPNGVIPPESIQAIGAADQRFLDFVNDRKNYLSTHPIGIC